MGSPTVNDKQIWALVKGNKARFYLVIAIAKGRRAQYKLRSTSLD